MGNEGGKWGGRKMSSPWGSSAGKPTEKSTEDILVLSTALVGVGRAAFG